MAQTRTRRGAILRVFCFQLFPFPSAGLQQKPWSKQHIIDWLGHGWSCNKNKSQVDLISYSDTTPNAILNAAFILYLSIPFPSEHLSGLDHTYIISQTETVHLWRNVLALLRMSLSKLVKRNGTEEQSKSCWLPSRSVANFITAQNVTSLWLLNSSSWEVNYLASCCNLVNSLNKEFWKLFLNHSRGNDGLWIVIFFIINSKTRLKTILLHEPFTSIQWSAHSLTQTGEPQRLCDKYLTAHVTKWDSWFFSTLLKAQLSPSIASLNTTYLEKVRSVASSKSLNEPTAPNMFNLETSRQCRQMTYL